MMITNSKSGWVTLAITLLVLLVFTWVNYIQIEIQSNELAIEHLSKKINLEDGRIDRLDTESRQDISQVKERVDRYFESQVNQ
ncbi:hypothetical protein [Reinekea sp.]|jgi:hypothetical protein|uniref:hypothetical protein n=1 Tax=Reinekea sp. TaxID=1970455 RepID=UPI003989E20C